MICVIMSLSKEMFTCSFEFCLHEDSSTVEIIIVRIFLFSVLLQTPSKNMWYSSVCQGYNGYFISDVPRNYIFASTAYGFCLLLTVQLMFLCNLQYVLLKFQVFWDMMFCHLVASSWHLGL
jgi:hypothetical protein